MNDFDEFDNGHRTASRHKYSTTFIVVIVVIALLCIVAGLSFGYLMGTAKLAPASAEATQSIAEPTMQPDGAKDDAKEANSSNVTNNAEATDKAIDRPQVAPQIGGSLPALQNSGNQIVDVVDAVNNSVVVITSTKTQNVDEGRGNRFRYGSSSGGSVGSGFIISKDGYIVTNNHLVDGMDTFEVTFADQEHTEMPVKATLVGVDPSSDLAVLKVERSNLTVAALGDSNQVKVGQVAIAIGSPTGSGFSNSVTVGYISALNRQVTSSSVRYLQTDAAINPGNSGGPLLNTKGEVIGINTLKTVTAGFDESGQSISAEGLGFAIPISDAKPIIEELIVKGSYAKPGIGVSVSEVTAKMAEANKIPQGVGVVSVYNDTPAQKAGLRANDIIVGVDGGTIKSWDELNAVLKTKKIGDKISVKVWREDKELDLTFELIDINSSQYTTERTQDRQTPQDPINPPDNGNYFDEGNGGDNSDGFTIPWDWYRQIP